MREPYGRWRLGASLGYGETDYSFSGTTGFGGLDPWNRIRDLRVSLPIQYFASESWTLYAIPSLRYNAESGASLSDGRTGGVLAGAAYRVNDRLTIGPGFGIFSEIEDDTSFFPMRSSTGKSPISCLSKRAAALPRPGDRVFSYVGNTPRAGGLPWVVVMKKPASVLTTAARPPGGVGQDKAVPLYVQAEYRISEDIGFNLIGGAETGANLRLEDAAGQRISSSDLSTAPCLGATFQTRF